MIGHVLECAPFELVSFAALAQEDEIHQIKTPFGTWVHLRRAGEALHPEREPLVVLEKQRRSLGTAYFAAQYLQSPTPPGDHICHSQDMTADAPRGISNARDDDATISDHFGIALSIRMLDPESR